MTLGVESNGSRKRDDERHDEAAQSDVPRGEPAAPVDAPARRSPRAPLTERQKRIMAVALVVHAFVVVLTLRDLRRRPAAGVRGPKWAWALAAMLNTSGSVAYWVLGRRHAGGEGSVP